MALVPLWLYRTAVNHKEPETAGWASKSLGNQLPLSVKLAPFLQLERQADSRVLGLPVPSRQEIMLNLEVV
jgi:hypothetical protein